MFPCNDVVQIALRNGMQVTVSLLSTCDDYLNVTNATYAGRGLFRLLVSSVIDQHTYMNMSHAHVNMSHLQHGQMHGHVTWTRA